MDTTSKLNEIFLEDTLKNGANDNLVEDCVGGGLVFDLAPPKLGLETLPYIFLLYFSTCKVQLCE